MLIYVKKFTVFALISVGASFVLFLFFGNANPTINSFDVLGNKNISLSGQSQPTGIFNRFIDGASMVLGISSSNTTANNSIDQINNVSNLTEIFAKLIAGKMIEGNPNGSQQIGGQESFILPGNLNLADPGLQQKMIAYKNEALSPFVDIKKFNTTETTKKEDLTKYILLIHSSYREIVDMAEHNFNADSFGDVIKNYLVLGQISEKYLSALYSIQVPTVLIDFHKKITMASEAQKNIAFALLDHKNDPLKASMVGELQEELNALYIKLAKEEIGLVAKLEIPVNLKLLISE